jgi:hypothetical protein
MPDINHCNPSSGSWIMAGSYIWYPAHVHNHSTFRVGSVLVIPDVLGRYTLDQTDDSFPNPRNSASAPGERGGKQ